MKTSSKVKKITQQQSMVLTLLFKFRFVTANLLAQVIGTQRRTVHEGLESLVATKLVQKVYDGSYRINRKPAYYYLNKSGVTLVRNILKYKESDVHALYGNDKASDTFIEHCLSVLSCYVALKQSLPASTQIFTKSEINRFKEFPKNRPDLYVRTTDNKEAIVVLAHDSQPYIIMKKLDEIIEHSEDEGWNGDYPAIAFVLKDNSSQNTFLYKVNKKLENMGMDEDEITVLATSLKEVQGDDMRIWHNAFTPHKKIDLFKLSRVL